MYLYREGKGGRKSGREASLRERNIYQRPPVHIPTGDQTRNPGTCPDQEPNQRPSPLSHTSQGMCQNILSARWMGNTEIRTTWKSKVCGSACDSYMLTFQVRGQKGLNFLQENHLNRAIEAAN